MAGSKRRISRNLFVPIATLGLCLSLLRESLVGEVNDLILLENGSLSFLDVSLVAAFRSWILAGVN